MRNKRTGLLGFLQRINNSTTLSQKKATVAAILILGFFSVLLFVQSSVSEPQEVRSTVIPDPIVQPKEEPEEVGLCMADAFDKKDEAKEEDRPQKMATKRVPSKRQNEERVSVAIVTLFKNDYKPEIQASKAAMKRNVTQEVIKGRFFGDEMRLGQLSIENKLDYGHRHRYPVFFYHNSLIDPTRSPSWAKIPVIQHYLGFSDWILWSDIDAFCSSFSSSLLEHPSLFHFISSCFPDVLFSSDLLVSFISNQSSTRIFYLKTSSAPPFQPLKIQMRSISS